MSKMDPSNLDNLSLVELFRMEVEAQSKVLTDGLLGLESRTDAARWLTELMRAAHSLKGAARIVGRKSAVRIAHAMEECFVAAQKEKLQVSGGLVDALLQGTDFIERIAQVSEDGFESWEKGQNADIEAFLTSLKALSEATEGASTSSSSASSSSASSSSSTPATPASEPVPASTAKPVETPALKLPELPELRQTSQRQSIPQTSQPPAIPKTPSPVLEDSGSAAAERSTASDTPVRKPASPASDSVLRVTAENLNRLMGLAGEAMVASRWLETFAADLARLKTLQRRLYDSAVQLGGSAANGLSIHSPEYSGATGRLQEFRNEVAGCEQSLADRTAELEQFDRRFVSFSKRLYHEVLDCRMRPFADGIQGLSRMVRDVARVLGKQVKLEITGEATLVDRDILDRIKAPLDHLLRNALDHGIEMPSERRARGKADEGTLHLQASHSAGMLLVTIADDGGGVDLEAVRRTVVARNLTTLEITNTMSNSELLEFLFLPGFTLKEAASEISGRGVGLDIVQAMTKEVGGRVRIFSQSGQGTRFQLELPLTLSVVRTLLVEIGGEPYAFPLARIGRALKLSRDKIEVVQGRQHFALDGDPIGLVAAHQALDLEEVSTPSNEVSVIVLGEANARYGVVIDRFLGERELVVRSLDPRLGKVKNISSAALMPDGSPVLIIDVDDLKRSIENLASGKLHQLEAETGTEVTVKKKRVLVVDDSLTVRELERKLLASRGYAVDVAVDGMDGWNAVRTGRYDLVVTDIDMPRLDGIELLTLIRKDNRLKTLPVAIVSYKDRQEDRNRGMEAGADYYLTKASFHDETLLRVVHDLIGGATS